MNMRSVLLAMVGVTVSLIMAMVLIGYSKRTITKTISRHQVLHLLRVQGMSHEEFLSEAKKLNTDFDLVSPKLIHSMLRKLQSEGLIQKTSSDRYVITTMGLEDLKNLESMHGEFHKVAKIVQKTSMISKILVTEAIDRIASMSDDSVYKTYNDSSQVETESVPIYGANRQSLQMISEEGLNQ